MYHQILDEAVQELKDEEFKDLFETSDTEKYFVSDTKIETDLELLIPEEYVEQTTERLILYKQLDSLTNEKELEDYREMLIDRFGPYPKEVNELLNTMRLRWKGSDLGFEKLVLKNNKMVAWFIHDENSEYFNSPKFQHILNYLQINRESGRMKEQNNKLSLIFEDIKSVSKAIERLEKLSM
jgi:transcription-repair coupling factor (superfamily II helicase)